MKSDGRRAHSALLLTAQLDLPIVVYLDDFEKECLVVLQMDTSVCCHWFFKEGAARPVRAGTGKRKGGHTLSQDEDSVQEKSEK
jgi:hypothetical protein